MKNKIMAHLVLGYPSLQESIHTAGVYVEEGCSILELQIPFSHPTADGPVITHACREAIVQPDTTVEDCLTAIKKISGQYPLQEIFVMSYLNRVFTFGIDRFAASLTSLGIRHVIIPDLPTDSPMAGLFRQHGLSLVPVVAANIKDERLESLLKAGYDFFYLMSDFKITGSGFSLHPRLEEIIQKIKIHSSNIRTGIGFGISQPSQIRAIQEFADYSIVGSALIEARDRDELRMFLRRLLIREDNAPSVP